MKSVMSNQYTIEQQGVWIYIDGGGGGCYGIWDLRG